MPAVSEKQKHLMDAAAHNPAFAKKVGIPTKVAKEFSKASKGQTFSKGGRMADTKMGKPVTKPGMSTAKGGMKFAKGGFVKAADGVASKGKTKAKQVAMCGGGMAKGKK